ncbi:MAG: 5-(carboxyamino)imidazole ribonucleotide synthase [Gemmatimonadales bacterium]|nr:MAG: 5-(carboxyamino)imidazole ribonucleotide synthase [Gemmatimonadales bacterium]
MRVGIIGGGQLGRMMALAGIPLGLRFRFLEPNEDPPCASVGEVVRGAYDDPDALDRFSDGVDVITYEFENVPVDSAKRLSERVPVYPPPMALEVAQDRLVEKETFRALDIGTAPYRKVDTREELDRAVEELGLPAVLKTRRLGYDGKGQAVLEDADSVAVAWERLGGRPLIVESFVDFARELSCLAVRSRSGELRVYPLVENMHTDGILRESRAPAPGITAERAREAAALVERLLDHLDYVGVLAVEFFETDDGLLANEMAPRVHNSGHWSQDGGGVSQFENHIRAILGLPLGDPRPTGWAGMVNLIGGIPSRGESLGAGGARLHLYGKEPRPGRKLGHLNVRADTLEGLERRLAELGEIAARHGEG